MVLQGSTRNGDRYRAPGYTLAPLHRIAGDSGFRQRYREMEISFHKSVGTLLAATDIDGDIREQWAREVSRDFDPPALDFILRRLAKHSSAELAEMASSFAFDSCEVHPEQLAILSPYLQHD